MANKKLISGSILAAFVLMAVIIYLPCYAFAGKNAMVIDLEGPISSGASTFLTRAITRAEDSGSGIIVIRMDTPGGLGVSMKTMAKSILNAPIPVIVYVSPTGASAASAGVLITISGHIAAMAPGTNIGAAHPVQADGSDINETMEKKIVNDMASYGRSIADMKGRNAEWVEKAIRESVSVTAEEAVRLNVIDLVASDINDLLKQVDGREVETNSGKVTIDTRDVILKYYSPRNIDKLLMLISNPTIMAILFSIGLLGLGFEITHPGAIFPGVIGAISLILAFYSMQTLPVDYAGLLLIFLAVILFIAEIKITSYGLLSLGGFISLIIGSMMFFEELGWNFLMIVPFIIVIGGFFGIVVFLAVRSQISQPKGGTDGLINETGIVKKKIEKEGLIFIHGEYWRAESDSIIEPEEKVKVIEINGLVLKVEKI
jgi:membrane-bound serine protease (ClpP class)